MIKKEVTSSRTANWGRSISFLLILALLLPAISMASAAGPESAAAARVQPVLLALAAERPDETVGVIVQKVVQDDSVENLVVRLGGVVIKDLHIINAFAAQLPAKAVPALGRATGVRWVSLDAPVVQADDDCEDDDNEDCEEPDSGNYYLHNDPILPAGDTASHAVLPLGRTVPTAETLYNYDVDRDAGPGLLIRRGGSGADETDTARIQRWRLAPFETDVQLSGHVVLKFYAAMKDFQEDRYGKVWGYLIDRNGDQVTIIASGFKETSDWDDEWERETIKFEGVQYLVPRGHQLEIALTVDGASNDDMWFAFGTKKYAAHLKINFLLSWPNHFLDTIGVPEVWAQGYEGQGVRVAVVDSGVRKESPDFKEDGWNRIILEVNLNPDYRDAKDKYGHGTYMAGIIGSNGRQSRGLYKGVAPQVEMISVRVSDEWGGARESDVVAGLQWVLEHKDEYRIRVVNLSLNSTVAQSYHTSPLDAAVEVLWFNRLVVVVAGGNNGNQAAGVIYPPANDPFVIAVGATDDMGTPDPADDVLAGFSAYGTTPEGFFRPDVAAPGTYVVSTLGDHTHFKEDYRDHVVRTPDRNGRETNFVASGTSVSAAVVSGATALLLQAMPDLNPDQVKWLFMNAATAMPEEPGVGAGIVNVARAVETALSYGSADPVPAANTGLPASQLLWTGDNPVQWGSVNWGSVNWGSVDLEY